MNKEEILARSRNENKGMDIMELQSLEKASRIAAQVGMLLCCFVAVMEGAVTGQYGKLADLFRHTKHTVPYEIPPHEKTA